MKNTLYETDDLEQAKNISNNYDDVLVTYRNQSKKIPPVLTYKINGKTYSKFNPEYVEYLKEQIPGITDEDISIYINKEQERVQSAIQNGETQPIGQTQMMKLIKSKEKN